MANKKTDTDTRHTNTDNPANISNTENTSSIDEQEKTCGIVMPISDNEKYQVGHWTNVKEIIERSIVKAGFNPQLVSEDIISGTIHNRIVNNIVDCEILVCDVSSNNPNVMFELGLRLAFDKPTIIIKDQDTPFSFDTQLIEHVMYPASLHYQKIEKFINDLSQKIKGTYDGYKSGNYTTFIGHFSNIKPANIKEEDVSFLSYIEDKFQEIERSNINLLRKLDNIKVSTQKDYVENESHIVDAYKKQKTFADTIKTSSYNMISDLYIDNISDSDAMEISEKILALGLKDIKKQNYMPDKKAMIISFSKLMTASERKRLINIVKHHNYYIID